MTKNRATVLLACLAFSLSFHAMYVYQLLPVWGYWGFTYECKSWVRPAIGIALCLIPGLMLPVHIRRPSSLINWVMYLTVYVPSVLVPLYVREEVDFHTAALAAGVVVGFACQCAIPCVRRVRFERPRVSARVVWMCIAVFTLGLTAYMLATHGKSMRFVSFADVYAMRSDLDLVGFENYAKYWLASALYPLLIAHGLFERNRWLVALGAGGEVMLYAMVAMKSILLSVPVYIGAYFLLRKEKNSAGIKFAAAACALVWVSCATAWFSGPVALMTGAVIGMRTFGTPGLCTHQYDVFFASHPCTYLSHVHGIDQLIQYPYSYAIPTLIGQYFYNNIDLVANSHPFAQDALAGFGVFGIVPIGILLGAACWLLDCTALDHVPAFACVFSVYVAMNFGNASLFTTVTSFGLWLVLVILYFLPARLQAGREVAA